MPGPADTESELSGWMECVVTTEAAVVCGELKGKCSPCLTH